MAKVIWTRIGITKERNFNNVEEALDFVDDLNEDDAVETVICNFVNDADVPTEVRNFIREYLEAEGSDYLPSWDFVKPTIH